MGSIRGKTSGHSESRSSDWLTICGQLQVFDTSGGTKPVWQALLDQAVTDKADALIDCGALLAGISNGYACVCFVCMRVCVCVCLCLNPIVQL
jgi:hypothetical protein